MIDSIALSATIVVPLLACLILLLSFRRWGRTRPRRLATRVAELNEQLQRERIESANRFAAIDARLSALEDEHSEERSRHRDDLTQIGQALLAHQRALDQTIGGLDSYRMQPEAPNTSAEIAPARSAAAPR